MSDFFLFIQPGVFVLSEKHMMSESEQTLDVRLYDLSRCEKALQELHLISNMTREEPLEFFSFYLASFYPPTQDERQALYLTDPVVRLWVNDPAVLRRIEHALLKQK